MAATRYKARIDADGNLVLPVGVIAPGTEVEFTADVHPVGGDIAVLLRANGEELSTRVVDLGDPLTPEEEARERAILDRMASSNLDFWDNEVDNALYDNLPGA